MKHSDIIVPRGAENNIAIQFITENLKNRLRDKGFGSKEIVYDSLPFNTADNWVTSVGIESGNRALVDKIILKLLNNAEPEMQPVHISFLMKQLIKLFKSSNPDFNNKEW